ncbi:MAG: hypothetical protein IPK79_09640 [Vampirovibrionales bacterium]|nr:hypothetical protein [Vampirovibrionales bacterium]
MTYRNSQNDALPEKPPVASFHTSLHETQFMASRLPEYHQLDWRGYLDDDWDEILDEDEAESTQVAASSHPSLDYPYEWIEHIRQMSAFRKQLRQFSEKFCPRACAAAAG